MTNQSVTTKRLTKLTWLQAMEYVKTHGGIVTRPDSRTISSMGIVWSPRFNRYLAERGETYISTEADRAASN